MTPAESLIVTRAAADWAPSPDDLALAAACDDAAYLRAWGQRETRTLDTALRIKRAQVERVLRGEQRRQLAAARATLKARKP